MTETVEIAGKKFDEMPNCTFGDYGGNGSVGIANLNWLDKNISKTVELSISDFRTLTEKSYGDVFWEEREKLLEMFNEETPRVIFVTYGYSDKNAYYLVGDDELEELAASLSDYPCIDDCYVSEVESQWEEEAFESWARQDLNSEAEKLFEEKFPHLTDDLEFDDILEKLEAHYLEERKGEASNDFYHVQFAAYRDAMEIANEYPTPEYSASYIPVDRIKEHYFNQIMENWLEYSNRS